MKFMREKYAHIFNGNASMTRSMTMNMRHNLANERSYLHELIFECVKLKYDQSSTIGVFLCRNDTHLEAPLENWVLKKIDMGTKGLSI